MTRECMVCDGTGGGDEPMTQCSRCQGSGIIEFEDDDYDDEFWRYDDEPEPTDLEYMAELIQECEREDES